MWDKIPKAADNTYALHVNAGNGELLSTES